jgi:hypothetical protein
MSTLIDPSWLKRICVLPPFKPGAEMRGSPRAVDPNSYEPGAEFRMKVCTGSRFPPSVSVMLPLSFG